MLFAIRSGFTSRHGDRTDYPNVMIVLTDGQDTTGHGENIRKAHALAVARNITSIAIGVGKGINYKELLIIAGSRKRVFSVESYVNLTSIAGQVCHEIQGT